MRAVGYAAMAYWYYRWDWGEVVALDGLDVCATLVDESHFSSWVDREVNGWLTSAEPESVSPMGPLGAAVRRLEQSSLDHRGPEPEVVDGLLARLRDANGRSGALTLEADADLVFVDSLYGLPASVARLALMRDDVSLLLDLLGWVERHCELLQDPATGLFAHYAALSGATSADQAAIAWGRGNGWAALGLADLLAALSGADGVASQVRLLSDRYQRLVGGLLEHEVPGGGWRNLVDEPTSYPEGSTTAMVVASLGVARQVMTIDTDAEDAMNRGWAAIADRVDTNGHVVNVSYRPGINTDPARYEHTPAIGAYPWGQGAWLRAAAAVTASD